MNRPNNKDDIMDILQTISSNIKELGNDIKGLNNDMKERNEKWKLETDKLKENTEVGLKQVSVCNDNNMTKNSEEIINKVSDSYKEELISSGDKIVENRTFKGDTVGNSDDDEKVNLLEVTDGVVISIDELDKEWKESLQIEGLQGVNFPVVLLLSLIHI